jgi:hypothetical protein
MKEQYDKRVKSKLPLREGMFVWIKHVPRGKGISKLKHTWKGPAKLLEYAGYDNWVVECGWKRGERMLIHASSCVSYHESDRLLQTMLEDGLDEIEDNPLHHEEELRPVAVPSRASAIGFEEPKSDGRRSARVVERLARETAATVAREAKALSEVDDCGIRRRERRVGRGGRLIPFVEVRHGGQWKWLSWDDYWKGPQQWGT